MPELHSLWSGLGWPLLRLCFFISLGVFIGNFIESLNWTRFIAKLAYPLVKLGHLQDISGASFSLAFFSGVTANTMLAEAYDQGRLSKKELILSNLFNSLPTYFLHLPTTFFIIAPLIKKAAIPYFMLTISSAFLRTFFIVLLARFILPAPKESGQSYRLPNEASFDLKEIAIKTWKRFGKRMRKILSYTVPIYVLVFFLHRFGVFQNLENIMAKYIDVLSWLPPQALSIVALQLAAEFTAGLAAAGALLDSGSLMIKEVVLALIVGNILSSPMRAIRHQLPYYAGIYKPALAVRLIIFNQSFRIGSLMLVALVYYYFC
ncbi:hypothetical protein KFV02_02520 [Desulfohalobiaceae bacterium Ax17]|jgi:hypothetical protein|uniref:hypothetical protein n=1 Tax=Desulfovulcanus ferrireducens TaxID=2831190 RepID=UPI00207BAF4F|nr:hypothetical protein [Desulfovulcanus ferrireducens]MBT8762802.1 hypothetical protein [Desulfovulcanus ferrireducens]